MDDVPGNSTTMPAKYTVLEEITTSLGLSSLALLCVAIGSIRAVGQTRKTTEADRKMLVYVTMREARWIPVFASIILFGLYCSIKWKAITWAILDAHFPSTSVAMTYLTESRNASIAVCEKHITIVPLPLKVEELVELICSYIIIYIFLLYCPDTAHLKGKVKRALYWFLTKWDWNDAVACVICILAAISHYFKPHWITNNLLGGFISIFKISIVHFPNFKTGTVLLIALFFYDIFWCFGTDVMETVARNAIRNGPPALLQFPIDLYRNGWTNASKHRMLGLGDVIIPGRLIALLRRFDLRIGEVPTPSAAISMKQKRSKTKDHLPTQSVHLRIYFYIGLVAYMTGLFITIAVAHYFKSGQPALLYLVPCCLIAPLAVSHFRGEFDDLWNYSEEHLIEKEKEPFSEKKNNYFAMILVTSTWIMDDVPGNFTTIPVKYTFMEEVTASLGLSFLAVLCVVIGSIRSVGQTHKTTEPNQKIQVYITMREARLIPILLSTTLFGTYCILTWDKIAWPRVDAHITSLVSTSLTDTSERNISAGANRSTITSLPPTGHQLYALVGVVITGLIMCINSFALATLLKPLVSFLSRFLSICLGEIPLRVVKGATKYGQFKLSRKWNRNDTIACAISAVVGISHFFKPHWITNNLLGCSVSIFGISFIRISSFKTATLLLIALFFYDIFWVFATDVMETVAMSAIGNGHPVLLQFPVDLYRHGLIGAKNHSMLGLGDINIPGLFLGLLRRFDLRIGEVSPTISTKKKQKRSKTKDHPPTQPEPVRTYFYIGLVAYMTGLFITMAVMHYFRRGQPALLYLVPCCLIAPIAVSLFRGEFIALWNYSEDHLADKTRELLNENKNNLFAMLL